MLGLFVIPGTSRQEQPIRSLKFGTQNARAVTKFSNDRLVIIHMRGEVLLNIEDPKNVIIENDTLSATRNLFGITARDDTLYQVGNGGIMEITTSCCGNNTSVVAYNLKNLMGKTISCKHITLNSAATTAYLSCGSFGLLAYDLPAVTRKLEVDLVSSQFSLLDEPRDLVFVGDRNNGIVIISMIDFLEIAKVKLTDPGHPAAAGMMHMLPGNMLLCANGNQGLWLVNTTNYSSPDVAFRLSNYTIIKFVVVNESFVLGLDLKEMNFILVDVSVPGKLILSELITTSTKLKTELTSITSNINILMVQHGYHTFVVSDKVLYVFELLGEPPTTAIPSTLLPSLAPTDQPAATVIPTAVTAMPTPIPPETATPTVGTATPAVTTATPAVTTATPAVGTAVPSTTIPPAVPDTAKPSTVDNSSIAPTAGSSMTPQTDTPVKQTSSPTSVPVAASDAPVLSSSNEFKTVIVIVLISVSSLCLFCLCCFFYFRHRRKVRQINNSDPLIAIELGDAEDVESLCQPDGYKIPWSELCNTILIGQGNSGFVFKAVYRVTHETVAMKESKKKIGDLMTEINTLCSLRQRDILMYYGWTRHDNSLYMITEYCSKGSLSQILKDSTPQIRDVIALKCVAIARALAYIHDRKWVHMDVAARNILVDSVSQLKLADMGLITPEGAKIVKPIPVAWCPPEALRQEKYACPLHDSWSFGCLLYEILTGGTQPFSISIPVLDKVRDKGSERLKRVQDSILAGNLPAKPTLSSIGSVVWDQVISNCWVPSQHRLQLPQIISSLESIANNTALDSSVSLPTPAEVVAPPSGSAAPIYAVFNQNNEIRDEWQYDYAVSDEYYSNHHPDVGNSEGIVMDTAIFSLYSTLKQDQFKAVSDLPIS